MGILYLARHGETEHNLKEIYMGQRDIELNKTGRKQADDLGKQLKNKKIDIIITSSLKRCKETSEIINKYINKKIITEPLLIEIYAGEYEGLSKEEISKKFPEFYKKRIKDFHEPFIPGAESFRDIEKRVFQALDKIKREYSDKDILIVTHGFVARIINKYLNPNISVEEFFEFKQLKNGEFRKFEF